MTDKKTVLCQRWEESEPTEETSEELNDIVISDRIHRALELISSLGGIDGAHHKQWLLDQVVRTLTGDEYTNWVRKWEIGDGAEGGEGAVYEWDAGIAP